VKNGTTIYSKRAGHVLLIGALALGVVFLGRYLGVFALAALTTMLFYPLHDWLRSKRYTRKLATALTLIAATVVLVVPILVVIGLSFDQADKVVQSVKNAQETNSSAYQEFTNNVSTAANNAGIDISPDKLQQNIADLMEQVIPGIINFIFHSIGGIAIFVTDVIVYFMTLAAMLSRKRELIDLLKRLSPLDKKIDDEYLSKVHSMARAMVKCTFLIAVIVSTISCITFWIIGIDNLAFWFLLFTIMSLIPLGAGIIYVPIGIILLLSGSVWQGALILITQFVILNNVNNVLVPLLSPKDSRLPGVLVLTSTFAGVGFFGLVGVIYGPIIMLLIYTSVQLYDRHRKTGLPLKTTA
jgi:predicted PurR-regulated permease PerM